MNNPVDNYQDKTVEELFAKEYGHAALKVFKSGQVNKSTENCMTGISVFLIQFVDFCHGRRVEL